MHINKGEPAVNSLAVITPQNNLKFLLDNNGSLTLQPAQVASVTGAASVSIMPANFNCNTLGDNVVTVTATGPPANPTAVKFFEPWEIAADANGNFYIADQGNNMIREIATDGTVSTYAGTGVQGESDGPSAQATFTAPTNIAAAPDGAIYVGDSGSGCIRKIVNGQVSTIKTAYFVSGLAVDANNNLYASKNNTIVKIADDGTTTVLIGSNSGLGQPFGLFFDKTGTLYIADIGDYTIWKFSTSGVLSPFVTNFPFLSYVYYVNGNPVNNYPKMVMDSKGNIFLVNGYVIWKITPAGNYSLFAGETQGFKDGQGTNAEFSGTWGIAIDKNDNLYVTDYKYAYDVNEDGNNAIRKITPDGVVTTLAGGIRGFSNGSLGGDNVSVLAVHVNIATQPAISPMPDVELNAAANCQAPLPDYTTAAKTSDPCSNVNLQVTQNPVAGTLINIGSPINVTLTVNDGYGGQSNTSFKVTVIPTGVPTITIQSDNTDICPGTAVTFTAVPVNGGSNPQYTWQVNGTQAGGNNSIFTSSDLKSTDIVNCILTDNDLCNAIHTAVSNSLSIVVEPLITSSISIKSSENDVCPGTPMVFTATPVGAQAGAIYQWQVNNVNKGDNSLTFSSAALNEGDQVTCKLINSGKCLANTVAYSNIIVVHINTTKLPAVIVASSSSQPVCSGSPVTFTAQITNAGNTVHYQWEVNGTYTSNDSQVFSSSTLSNGDIVTCTISGTQDCTAPVTSEPLVVNISQLPNVAFNSTITIKAGNSVQLFPVIGGNVITYNWQPATGLSNASVANPVAKPAYTTTYQLTVTNNEGCSDTASITVNVVQSVVIPNTFTPNGDGINDKWNINALQQYTNCTVNVFTRYGQNIFRSVGYANPWDGSYSNKIVPSGTYYYIIDLKNGQPPLSGFVTVLR